MIAIDREEKQEGRGKRRGKRGESSLRTLRLAVSCDSRGRTDRADRSDTNRELTTSHARREESARVEFREFFFRMNPNRCHADKRSLACTIERKVQVRTKPADSAPLGTETDLAGSDTL